MSDSRKRRNLRCPLWAGLSVRTAGIVVSASGVVLAVLGIELGRYIVCWPGGYYPGGCGLPYRVPGGWLGLGGLSILAIGLAIVVGSLKLGSRNWKSVYPVLVRRGLLLAGIACLFVASQSTWWSVSSMQITTNGGEVRTSSDYDAGAHLFYRCSVEPPTDPASAIPCQLIADAGGVWAIAYASSQQPTVGRLYSAVQGILLGVTGAAAVGALCTIRVRFRESRRLERLGPALVGAAAVAAAAVSVAVTILHPVTAQADGAWPFTFGRVASFWGSATDEAGTIKWGAGAAWYLSIAGAVLLAIPLFLSHRPTRMAS